MLSDANAKQYLMLLQQLQSLLTNKSEEKKKSVPRAAVGFLQLLKVPLPIGVEMSRAEMSVSSSSRQLFLMINLVGGGGLCRPPQMCWSWPEAII